MIGPIEGSYSDRLVVNLIVTDASGHVGPHGEPLTIQLDQTTMMSVESCHPARAPSAVPR